MIFYENRLLADDSYVISYLIFFENWKKMSQNLSSAAVVIGALRVKNTMLFVCCCFLFFFFVFLLVFLFCFFWGLSGGVLSGFSIIPTLIF